MIYYDPQLTQVARRLRKNSTLAEVLLWKHLQKKKMLGYRFNRQKPIHNFIVDFYCFQLKLIIEIDSTRYTCNDASEMKRARLLNSLGFNVLRFQDVEILKNIDEVVFQIKKWIFFSQREISRNARTAAVSLRSSNTLSSSPQ